MKNIKSLTIATLIMLASSALISAAEFDKNVYVSTPDSQKLAYVNSSEFKDETQKNIMIVDASICEGIGYEDLKDAIDALPPVEKIRPLCRLHRPIEAMKVLSSFDISTLKINGIVSMTTQVFKCARKNKNVDAMNQASDFVLENFPNIDISKSNTALNAEIIKTIKLVLNRSNYTKAQLKTFFDTFVKNIEVTDANAELVGYLKSQINAL